jgi:acetyl-CoA C-acetyltransferase
LVKFGQNYHVSCSRYFHEVVVLSAVRIPVGSFQGSLSSLKAPQLGSIVVKSAVEKAGIQPQQVNEVILGNVLQGGQGQAPARQAAKFAGLPNSVCCTTINKVCSSGMKSVMIAAQTIMLGQSSIIVSGGFESMSNVPYYLDTRARSGFKMGDGKLIDGLVSDGLWDVYNQFHMGNCAEDCAKKYNISRKEQDEYAIKSYQRALESIKNGYFKDEIIPVTVSSKKGDEVISVDEEVQKVDFSKLPNLKPAFDKNGTVTAANASKINDGASALLLTSAEKAQKLHKTPIARIISFADAERDPIEFPTAPALAIPIALQRAGLSAQQIDFWEINEAFSVVALANIKELGLNPDKVNVLGGAVALGHPIGSSGSRIIVSLIHHLRRTGGRYGCAAICNGGGGASAIVIERL